jgi:hypothetical protein
MADELVCELTASRVVDFHGRKMRLCDLYKLVPSAEADNAKLAVLDADGTWKVSPVGVCLKTMKTELVQTVRQHLPSGWKGDLPSYCRKSAPLKAAAMTLINDNLYDPEFHAKMDNADTLKFLMFKCGACLDRDTMELCSPSPDLVITKHCGIDWPGDKLQGFEAQDNGKLADAFQRYTSSFALTPIMDLASGISGDLKDTLINKKKI